MPVWGFFRYKVWEEKKGLGKKMKSLRYKSTLIKNNDEILTIHYYSDKQVSSIFSIFVIMEHGECCKNQN